MLSYHNNTSIYLLKFLEFFSMTESLFKILFAVTCNIVHVVCQNMDVLQLLSDLHQSRITAQSTQLLSQLSALLVGQASLS